MRLGHDNGVELQLLEETLFEHFQHRFELQKHGLPMPSQKEL